VLEDMAVRQFGDKTRHDYIRHIESFARFLGRSLDTATAEDVRRFQVHLTERGVQPPTLNSSASALRFLFGTTLDRAELARHLARVHYPRRLPRVLSPQEVGRLLEAAPGPGLKYNVVERKSEIPSTTDEVQHLEVLVRIKAMPASRSLWRWQQADSLVVADGFDVDPCAGRQRANQ